MEDICRIQPTSDFQLRTRTKALWKPHKTNDHNVVFAPLFYTSHVHLTQKIRKKERFTYKSIETSLSLKSFCTITYEILPRLKLP